MTLGIIWQQSQPNPPGYTAAADRRIITAAFGKGVLRGGFKVGPRAAGATMSVDIAAGMVAIAGNNPDQGTYLGWSTAVENRTLAAAPGTGLTRIDRVVARSRDSFVRGGGDNDMVLEVIAGTPSASPAAPAMPPDAVELAQITIASGTASINAALIADTRVWALPADGVPAAAGVNLGDRTIGSGNEFVQWGSDLVVGLGASPRRITAYGVLTGMGTVAASNATLETRVELSVDRGATWTAGPLWGALIDDGFHPQSGTAQHTRVAVPPVPPIGQEVQVRARAMVRRASGTVGLSVTRGHLYVRVDPA